MTIQVIKVVKDSESLIVIPNICVTTYHNAVAHFLN